MDLLVSEVTRKIQNDADICELVDAFYHQVRAEDIRVRHPTCTPPRLSERPVGTKACFITKSP